MFLDYLLLEALQLPRVSLNKPNMVVVLAMVGTVVMTA
jgi:hypothetical protein